MGNKAKENEQLNVSEEQLNTLKDVLLHRLKIMYYKEEKYKPEIKMLVDAIREERRVAWISGLFQILGLADIGAMIYRLNDMASTEIVGGFILGGLSLILGSIFNYLARKNRKDKEQDLITYIKVKANDKSFMKDKDWSFDDEIVFGNIKVPEETLDKQIQEACVLEFDNYRY